MEYKKILETVEIRLDSAFKYFEKVPNLGLIVAFILALVVRLVLTPYNLVLREDAYVYLLKGIEITNGNLDPMLSSAIGWPLFLSPFLYLSSSASLFQNMAYVRIISNFIGAFSIFPLAYIARRIMDKRSEFILLILFAFASNLIILSTSAYTEPLFTFLLIISLYFMCKAIDNWIYILGSSIFAAFAFYVRPNGFFILIIILLSFFILRKQIPGFNYRQFMYILVIFLVVTGPFLFQRHIHFGSAFFYGEGSKYFVDTYQEVWSRNVHVPSLFEYLRDHNVYDYINKFIIHGIFNVMFDYGAYVVPRVLLLFFLFGFIRYFNFKEFIPLSIVLLVWIIGFSAVFHVYDVPRYLYPTIPIILIFSSVGIREVFKNNQYKNILICTILIIFISTSLIYPINKWSGASKSEVHDGLEWGEWAAKNVEGSIAIIEGGDLIMMHLNDSTMSVDNTHDFLAPKSNLSVIRPGYFKNSKLAMMWFKEIGVTHLAIDDKNIERRPYLKEICCEKEVPPYLTEIYSNYDTDSRWKMRIFYIDWDEYEEGQTNKTNARQ